MMVEAPVITIDGASGTGKGVVTSIIAQKLNWNLLDSGVLYRVLALAAIKKDISLDNESVLAATAEDLAVQFVAEDLTQPVAILLANEDVTNTIRTEEIGNAASIIGALPAVRTALLARQRAFRTDPGLVTDGRDMGTVVFPDAQIKVFLRATPEERARRRYKQLLEKGINVNLDGLIDMLRERDERDQKRAIAPLVPAVDALIIETDHLTIEEVVAKIMTQVKNVFTTYK
jgi:cytidylate kinase